MFKIDAWGVHHSVSARDMEKRTTAHLFIPIRTLVIEAANIDHEAEFETMRRRRVRLDGAQLRYTCSESEWARRQTVLAIAIVVEYRRRLLRLNRVTRSALSA